MEELVKLFNERYEFLNSKADEKVVLTPLTDSGKISIPTVGIVGDGFEGKAVAEIKLVEVDAVQARYAVKVPTEELEICLKNKDYFYYLMDRVVNSAFNEYQRMYGSVELMRFGQSFAKFGMVSKDYDNNFLVIEGCFAKA